MRPFARLLFAALFLSTITWAQTTSQDTDLLARFSYQQSPFQTAGFFHQMCISVSQDGSYRMVTSSKVGADGPILIKGKMSAHQLLTLKRLLIAPAFRSLSGNDAGMIRNHAESFRAEISRVEIRPAFQLLDNDSSQQPRAVPGPPRRLQWLNADDESPFPAPISDVIDWMKRLKPKNAQLFDYSDFADVCPSVGFSLVQPSVATNSQP